MRTGIFADILVGRKIPIGDDSGGKMNYDQGAYTCASDRYITQGTSMTGPFAANVLATRMIGGYRYAQIEAESTNAIAYTNDITNAWWNNVGYLTRTADVSLSPLGTMSMDSIIETTDNNYHGVWRSALSLAPKQVVSLYMRYHSGSAARTMRINTNDDLSTSWFNPSTGLWGTKGANHIDHFVHALDGGIYYIGLTTLDTAIYYTIAICAANEARIYAGDGVSGFDVWGMQATNKHYPSSYIPATSSIPITRSKDVLIMPNAVVPAFLKASTTPFTTNLCFNNYSSTQLAADGGKKYLFSVDGTSDIECYLNGADNKIYIDQGGVNKFTSTAKTWAIGANPKVSIIPDNGSSECRVITSGFATGDGTETGTAFAQQTDGVWSIGSKFTTDDQQLDGMIAEFRQGLV